MDTLYARQLESIRESAGRARGKLLSVRERSAGHPGQAPLGGSPVGGGGAAAGGGLPAPPPLARTMGALGTRPIGALSFQEALAFVRTEHLHGGGGGRGVAQQ